MSNFVTVTFASLSFSLLFVLSLLLIQLDLIKSLYVDVLSLNLCFSVIQALIPSQQQGTYYTQPLYAAPPHVIHHTTVVQPNGMPAAMYAPPIPPPRHNGVAMGMVAGTTMAMSAGENRFPFPHASCFWEIIRFFLPQTVVFKSTNKNSASVDLE